MLNNWKNRTEKYIKLLLDGTRIHKILIGGLIGEPTYTLHERYEFFDNVFLWTNMQNPFEFKDT